MAIHRDCQTDLFMEHFSIFKNVHIYVPAVHSSYFDIIPLPNTSLLAQGIAGSSDPVTALFERINVSGVGNSEMWR